MQEPPNKEAHTIDGKVNESVKELFNKVTSNAETNKEFNEFKELTNNCVLSK